MNTPSPTVLESLNTGLHYALQADPRVLLIGEDLLDPYGGAFKASRGLSTAFPDRVWSSPISEAGIVGLAAGMALRGLRPVVEIMFGDFLTLAADQLINHAAKYRWMYNDQVRVPLVVRTPMGGRRGYGPTHSQTLEKHFLGAAGLQVVAPSTIGDPGALLAGLILENDEPLLFIENKLQYLEPTLDPAQAGDFAIAASGDPPVYRLRIKGSPEPVLTVTAYGYMADLTRQVLLDLAYRQEIFAELIVPVRLAPYEMEPVFDSVAATGRLLAVEEGNYTLGWGAEILARAAGHPGLRLQAARRVAAVDLPIPASGPLEALALPQKATIAQAIREMLLL
jgi:pyruvate/2-oxoglutarate/acetoin dehydrogenase E1 component